MKAETSISTFTSPTPAAASPAQRERAPLLPDSVKRPAVLLWVWIVPQLALLFLNIRAGYLMWGEATGAQQTMAAEILGAEIALLLGAGALVWMLRAKKQLVNLPWNLALLLAPVGFLVLVTHHLIGGGMIPASVSTWIVQPEEMLYYQFTLMMPAAFFAALRLCCFDRRVSLAVDVGTSLAAAVGVPLGSWILFRVIASVARSSPSGGLFSFVFVLVFVGGTIASIAALLRLAAIAYVSLRRHGPVALGVLIFFVGLAAPIGGLLLNRKLPFPADFQSFGVYTLALANGVLLLLPAFRAPRLHRAVWLAQCALFPFTVYFFAVFLPFLPLALLAIFAFGGGILMLAPSALFLLHGQKLLDGFHAEIRDGGRRKPALLACAALALMPAVFTLDAVRDRVVLREGIDYVFSPDYRRADHFSGDPGAMRRSLEHLRDFKAGIHLPFLSDYYEWIVFDNLVLPDDKMQRLHRAFFGGDLAPAKESMGSIFGAGERTRNATTRAAAATPTDVQLASLTSATTPEDGGCERTLVTLTMRNNSASVSEFVTPIHVPAGVLVSGFWLRIGTAREPGQIAEKKSAVWIYRQIRDRSRRDPGLLTFTAPDALELRVYPFAGHETRTVEIEFLRPEALAAQVLIGGRSVVLGGKSSGIVLAKTDAESCEAVIAPDALHALPKTERTPFLHFIIDRSADAALSPSEITARMRAAAAHFPKATRCAVTAANYEFTDLTKTLAPISGAGILPNTLPPARGGFELERAIKRALLQYRDRAAETEIAGEWLREFPLIVVVTDAVLKPALSADMAEFVRFAPDAPVFFSCDANGDLSAWDWAGQRSHDAAAKPVVLFEMNGARAACAADATQPVSLHFMPISGKPQLSAFDAKQNAFLPVTVAASLPPEARYSAGLRAQEADRELIFNPSLGPAGLARAVQSSRRAGVLVSSAAYIVLENSAQRKMLARKENQKLRNANALELEEIPAIPEPSSILLGGATLFVLLLITRRRRGSHTSPRSP